jgi:hypothetical protein
MENTANVGLFAVNRIVSQYVERIYADMEKMQRDSFTYQENTPRDIKVCISQLIIIQILIF